MTDESIPNLEHQVSQRMAKSKGPVTRLKRAIQIGQHYRWSQIARRGVSVLRSRLMSGKAIGEITCPGNLTFQPTDQTVLAARIMIESHRHHISHQQGDLSAGQLVLLNHAAHIGWPLNWKADVIAKQTHLWRFQLHYHEYLLSFVADQEIADTPTDSRWETVWQFIEGWIKAFSLPNVKVSDDAWHPYCISRRVVTWIWLLSVVDPPSETAKRITQSLFQQTEYLHDHLELDLRGNHLFENLTALVQVAGCLNHGTTTSWANTAKQHLQRELPVQILEHGEHFELSPMYHCQILGGLLRMACATSEIDPKLSELFQENAQSMLEFLEAILRPDDSIPLLGDSGFGEAPNAITLRKLAKACGLSAAQAKSGFNPTGPYLIYRSSTESDSDYLLFDRGAVCPAELPAHGHCDLLNIVASVGGRSWLVDSGNFDYSDDAIRYYCRSSMAHNVMTVDGANQCNIWSRFRMGHRGRITESRSGKMGGFDWATAQHDGYSSRGISQMQRLVAVNPGNHCWICIDNADDDARTNGRESLIGYLHISPRVSIVPINSPDNDRKIFQLNDKKNRRTIVIFGASEVEVVSGWYCPAFGFREQNKVITYRQTGPTSHPFGWILCRSAEEIQSIDSTRAGFSLNGGPTCQFEWKFD